jgi:glycosyltransferase involved in cell wall biosynthesis
MESSKLKISYIAIEKLKIDNFSGTGYFIPKSLETIPEIDMEYIDNLDNPRKVPLKALELYHYYVHHHKYISRVNPGLLKVYAKQIEARVRPDADVLFSASSRPFAQMEPKKPMVFWTDAVFAGLIDFYPEFTNLAKSTIIEGNRMEQQALDRISLAVYSSDWAAEIAMKQHNLDESKVAVVNYGANISNDLDFSDIKDLVNKKSSSECKLLFIGVHWKRKGGQKALEIADFLNRRGLKTTLTIVGVEPPPGNYPSYVKKYGFISKETEEGKNTLKKLIEESHFLILPTIADCTPIVFAEFNSYGIPVITTNVGGIPSVIKDGVNGFMMGVYYEPEHYAAMIMDYFKNFNSYKELCYSSFNEYKTRLNWKSASEKFYGLLKERF